MVGVRQRRRHAGTLDGFSLAPDHGTRTTSRGAALNPRAD
jgi:hypothetical protein